MIAVGLWSDWSDKVFDLVSDPKLYGFSEALIIQRKVLDNLPIISDPELIGLYHLMCNEHRIDVQQRSLIASCFFLDPENLFA